MRLFGFEITRKASFVAPVDNRGGWTPWIREPYSGAWQNGEEWTVSSVLSYPPVYACVTLIASDVAKLAPMVMRKGTDGIYVENDKSPFLKLLKRPNNYQNHIQFKEWWIISKAIRGNTYALKERDQSGAITKLHILDPTRVQALVSTSGEIFYQLSADNLAGIEESSVTVPAGEIIHDRINPLFHPLVGISPLYSCGESAAAGNKIIADSSYFFENGARPSGILTAPGAISDATAARLKEAWATNYTGANSGKIAVLGDALKFEPMRMTAVDAQLIDQMKWSAEAVCSAFHVPAYKVGIGATPTNNNVEALTQEYYSQCLQRYIEDIELCLDEGLEVPDGSHIELDLDCLFRMDTKTQFETFKLGVEGAIMAPNEARKKMNLRPLEGGDTIYMQQQNYSLSALAARDSMNPLSVQQTKPNAIENPAEHPNPDDAMKMLIDALAKEFENE